MIGVAAEVDEPVLVEDEAAVPALKLKAPPVEDDDAADDADEPAEEEVLPVEAVLDAEDG